MSGRLAVGNVGMKFRLPRVFPNGLIVQISSVNTITLITLGKGSHDDHRLPRSLHDRTTGAGRLA